MRNASFMTALILLLLTGTASTLMTYRPVPVVVATNLEKLPMEIDGYRAVEDTFPESVYKELNADKHLYRHYRSADGSVIDLYIGYYGTAKGGRTGHNPYACLPGAGITILEAKDAFLAVKPGVAPVKVNYILARNEFNIMMLHWYQTAGDKVVSSGLRQNLERFLGRVIDNRNDGAFVRVSALVSDKPFPAEKQRVEKFAAKVLNLLPQHWPIEQ
ncbi:exosortase C-terminal domain/associated protein EpsI [Geomonas anaerohicana]|uniref:EpsI family protein n=1 Tax=Geomonas anaerohicana TaxID=2798583 RepID=A0ABS0YBX0_9BACT|nr:exosortase C-terminal domain/associated protein EpsI [Geomonas anaerohicana]MBJ6749821.1 EpsI family protein [Geomonas anaerohicana]